MTWLPLLPVAHWEVTTGRRPRRLHFIFNLKDDSYPPMKSHQNESSAGAAEDRPTLKNKLRATLRAARRGVTDRDRCAVQVARNVGLVLARLPDLRNLTVAGYFPLTDELDSRPAMQMAAGAGARVGLAVVAGRDAPLVFRQWQPGDELEPGPFGTFHPRSGAALDPDILLVPLLGFDRTGHRLGYGAGYYDRTLAELRGQRSVLALGLAFDVQEVPEVPAEANDQALDMVITERRTLAFSPRARLLV